MTFPLPGLPPPDAAPLERLVAVLGHSLWQALLAAVLLLLILRRLPASRPEARYGWATAALAGVVLAVMGTWTLSTTLPRYAPSSAPVTTEAAAADSSPSPSVSAGSASPSGSSSLSAAIPADIASRSADTLSSSVRADENPALRAPGLFRSREGLLALAWMAGVVVMLGRMVRSVGGAGRLASASRRLEEGPLAEAARELAGRLGLHPMPALALCDNLSGPAVIGVLWPVILLPASLATGFPPESLRAILAHELAHVRRHDYLVNLGQMLVEALLFFNPAVWWISRQMRLEREACCDAAASRLMGNAGHYAGALADAAARLSSTPLPAPAVPPAPPAVAYGPESPRALLDRVRRVLLPGHRPLVRLPWYSVLGTLLGWSAVLAGLWGGSHATVALAVSALSAEERLERVQEEAKAFGLPDYLQPGAEDVRTTVSGTVRTSDGSPLPKDLLLQGTCQRPGYSGVSSIQVDDGAFESRISAGTAHFGVFCPDYAPAVAGPMELRPEVPLTGIDLVLEPGFSSRIRVTDEEDQPLSGVRILMRYDWPGDGFRAGGWPKTAVSGPDGEARLDHVGALPVFLDASQPGYEFSQRREERLSDNQVLHWSLRRARPAEGIVVEKATGKPIAGAALRLLVVDGPQGMNSSLDTATTEAVTDPDGRFRLTQLRGDSVYTYLVDTPSHRRTWLTGVKAGDQDLQVEVGPPLYIRGTVTGNLELLEKWDWKTRTRVPRIVVQNRVNYPSGNMTETDRREVPLEVRDGIGHFRVENLFAGQVTLSLEGTKVPPLTLDVTDPIDGLELSTEPSEDPAAGQSVSTRTVVLRFGIPEGAPAPEGTMRISYKGAPGDRGSGQHEPVPITGREMKIVVRTPSDVRYCPVQTLGYWFQENNTHVPEGDGEFVIDIPVRPAGSISGTVLEADGRPVKEAYAKQVRVSVLVEQRPAGLDHTLQITPGNTGPVSAEGRFHITPLPLDGVYRLAVTRGDTYAISDPIALTGSSPTGSAVLRIPEGVRYTVTLRDPEGRPAAGIPVRLVMSPFEGHSFSRLRKFTDVDGRIVLDGINPEPRFRYRLEVETRRDFRPVRLEANPALGVQEFVLERGRVIEGQVVSASSGRPVPGAIVYAVPKDMKADEHASWIRPMAEDKTDARGWFRFSNLEDRVYEFHVQDARTEPNQALVRAGDGTTVTLRIKSYPWSSLKVP